MQEISETTTVVSVLTRVNSRIEMIFVNFCQNNLNDRQHSHGDIVNMGADGNGKYLNYEPLNSAPLTLNPGCTTRLTRLPRKACFRPQGLELAAPPLTFFEGQGVLSS